MAYGAFDHVQRAAFLTKLANTPSLSALLPLVKMLYSTESRFLWTDSDGATHEILQGEGGGQGCPLMPALFALAQHDALVSAAGKLQPNERLFAFLDDLYVVSTPTRAATAFQTVAEEVETHAGVKSHLGKLRAWCRKPLSPPADFTNYGTYAWTSDKTPTQRGLVILGTPIGPPEFIRTHADERMQKELLPLRRLHELSDLQCQWVLLSQCATARANHTIRILPPDASRYYAEAHDEAIWTAFCSLLGAEDLQTDLRARNVASLPGREGGLGLRSAARTAPAAYWASWSNALLVLRTRAPDVAAAARAELERADGTAVACLQAARDSYELLQQAGATDLPTWAESHEGTRPVPLPPDGLDAMDFLRGWQCHASSFLETNFLEQQVKPSLDEPNKALLHSQATGPACAFLRAIPSEPAYTFRPERLQNALRRRVRWPLTTTGQYCGRSCTHRLDSFGDRAAACPRSGRLRLRSRPIEQIWIRILREAGIRLRENVYLRDTTLPNIDPADNRRIEIVATGLPANKGIPLAIDATLVSPLHADGSPLDNAVSAPGTALRNAERGKRMTYPELVTSPFLRLYTVATEIGGRQNRNATDLLIYASHYRARNDPPVLRSASARAWQQRWQTMLSVTVQDALVATLTEDTFPLLDASHGYAPQPTDVWLDMANLPTTTTARRAPDREAGSTTDERTNATNEPTNAPTHHANERPDQRTGEPDDQNDNPTRRRADEPADPRGDVTPTAALTAEHQAHEQAYRHADAPPNRRDNAAPTATNETYQGPRRPRATEDSWSWCAVVSSGSPGLAQAAAPRQTGWVPTPTDAPTPGALAMADGCRHGSTSGLRTAGR